jgi:hypothetical protein
MNIGSFTHEDIWIIYKLGYVPKSPVILLTKWSIEKQARSNKHKGRYICNTTYR